MGSVRPERGGFKSQSRAPESHVMGLSSTARIALAAAASLLLGVGAAVRAEPAEPDPNALVKCVENGHSVFKRRADCRGRISHARGSAHEEPGAWASLEAEAGVLQVPVLACRGVEDLHRITSTAAANRPHFLKAAFRAGKCTRLERNTAFAISDRREDALQIRTLQLGRLWVSPSVRIPDITEMAPAARLAPEPGAAAPARGSRSGKRDRAR